MKLERIECDVASGRSWVIAQTYYENAEGEGMVIDDGDPVPDGFFEADPPVDQMSPGSNGG